MRAHNIQVVTFDADGTIWDFEATMRKALLASLRSIQRSYRDQAAQLTVDDLVQHRQEAGATYRGQARTMESLRFAAFERTLDAIGVRNEWYARDLTDRYLERRFTDACLFDDALPVLNRLRSHFMLGLLTNGNSYPDKLGLDGLFSFVVAAQDHDVWKPALAFYEIAIQRAGVKPEKILHVGDRLDNDVLPARRAGMNAVWLNRTGQSLPVGLPPVATLPSLNALPAYLGMPDARPPTAERAGASRCVR